MNTTSKNLTAALVLASGLISGQQAFAGLINGDISFAGTVALNGPIATATAFTSFSDVYVTPKTQDGDYAGTDNTAVTANAFTFLPTLVPNPVTAWTFTIGSTTYDFLLNAPLTVIQNSHSLEVMGSGIAQISGFDDTVGTWDLTTQGRTATLSFSSTTSVPDGGSSALMLGSALVGVGFLRRALSK